MKKAFTLVELIGAIIILGMIALLAFPPLLNMIRGTNEEIDKASQTLLFTAVDQYIDSNKNEFPKTDGNTFCVSYGDLIKSESISNNIPNKSGNTIDANTMIKVLVNNGKYEYSIDNSCERKVKPTTIADALKQECSEENTVGLVKDTDGTCYYKGTNEEVGNNFVWFGGHLWRVISIDKDNNLTMITQQPLTLINPASGAWTTEEEYKNSYINTWLNEAFLGGMNDTDKTKIKDNTFNVVIYKNVGQITTTGKVGLLDKEQYTKAGEQNSFLDIKDYFWLGNLSSSNIPLVSNDGIIVYQLPSDLNGVRPVIKISNLTFTEGEGTLDNPYREKSTTTNTTNIKVGEYISVPTSGTDCGEDKRCLFRVVSKDNDSIKVILNGLLPGTSQFGPTATYTSGNPIDTKVTSFANTIDNQYRYTGNKFFNIGEYTNTQIGQDYKLVQKTRYTGTEENPVNVGLPVIGEMFSGNDIDVMASSKTFVNVNTIQNPIASSNFWLMNASNSCGVYHIRGTSYFASSTDVSGVRPVMFLKNNLTFASGEGTAENPFVLE